MSRFVCDGGSTNIHRKIYIKQADCVKRSRLEFGSRGRMRRLYSFARDRRQSAFHREENISPAEGIPGDTERLEYKPTTGNRSGARYPQKVSPEKGWRGLQPDGAIKGE